MINLNTKKTLMSVAVASACSFVGASAYAQQAEAPQKAKTEEVLKGWVLIQK